MTWLISFRPRIKLCVLIRISVVVDRSTVSFLGVQATPLWQASHVKFYLNVQHNFSLKSGHVKISAILPLLLILEDQLSVTGK